MSIPLLPGPIVDEMPEVEPLPYPDSDKIEADRARAQADGVKS